MIKDQSILTGFIQLDLDTKGGLKRGDVSNLLSSGHIGATSFLTSLGSNVLNGNFKVLHIHLEGSIQSTTNNYLSNLSGVPLVKIRDNALSDDDRMKIEKISKQNLKILNFAHSFHNTIEDLIPRCKVAYDEQPFDLIIVDNASLIETNKEHDFINRLNSTFKGLKLLAQTFNCAVFTSSTLAFMVKNDPVIEFLDSEVKLGMKLSLKKETDDERILSLDELDGKPKHLKYRLSFDPQCKRLSENIAFNVEIMKNEASKSLNNAVSSLLAQSPLVKFVSLKTFLDRLSRHSEFKLENPDHVAKGSLAYTNITLSPLSNKEIVSVLKIHLDGILKLKNQAYYELMSRVVGEKNYNIVSGKNIRFMDYFNIIESNHKAVNLLSLEDLKMVKTNKIPTGIPEFEFYNYGGLNRGSLSIVLGATDVSKNIFSLSLACNALRSKDKYNKSLGLKVLHLDLEGQIKKTYCRYISNLSEISYEKIEKEILTKEESELESSVIKEYSDRLKIHRVNPSTIEDLSELCDNIYKDFKFDLLVLNFPQLLGTKNKNLVFRQQMSEVFRGVDMIAKNLNCAIIAPATCTRESVLQSQEDSPYVFKGQDVSEPFEISRIAEMIFSVNFTEAEKSSGQTRLYIDKSREGHKGYTLSMNIKWDICNFTDGVFQVSGISKKI